MIGLSCRWFAAAWAAILLPAGPVAAVPAQFLRAGAVPLQGGENSINEIVFDARRGYVYAIAETSPVQIVKIRAATAEQPAVRVANLTLNAGESFSLYQSAQIDEAAGMLYVVTTSAGGTFVKVDVGEGDAAPARVAAALFDIDDGPPFSLAIDAARGFGYVATNPGGVEPTRIVKFSLGDGAAPPVRLGALILQTDERLSYGMTIDPAAEKLYVACANDNTLVQVSTGDGPSLPTRDGATGTAGFLTAQVHAAQFDPIHRLVHVASLQSFAQSAVFDVSGPLPVLLGTANLGPETGLTRTFAPDWANRIAFTGASTGNHVAKVSLPAPPGLPALIATAPAAAGEENFFAVTYDPAQGFAYAGNRLPNPDTIVVFQQPFSAAAPRLETTVEPVKLGTKKTGFTVAARGTVANPGPADTGEFRIRAFLSADDRLSYDDIPVAKELRVKNLKAGKSRRFSVRVAPQSGTPDNLRLLVVADTLNQVNAANRARAAAYADLVP